MKVASGNVADQPFARTVFSLASNRFTGDLVLHHKRTETKVVWTEGQIVAAHSSSPADAPGRQALAHGLVNSSTLGIFLQKAGEAPEKDQIALLSEVANLTPEQHITLKHHVFVRSASRIFGLAGAEFVVDNFPTIPADPQLPALDARWLIYFGLRTHYSSDRLKAELSAIGHHAISLSEQGAAQLPAFGFGEYEQHIIARLQATPYSLAHLLATGLDKNICRCLVYTLVACGCITLGAEMAPPEEPILTPPPPSDAEAGASAPTPAASRIGLHGAARSHNSSPDSTQDHKTAFKPAPAQPKNPLERATTIRLVDDKLKALQANCTHYEMLGIEPEDPDSVVRKAYFALARRLHPDHLLALGLEERADDIQEVFAAINQAFKVLSSPKELAHYREVMAAGGEKAYRAKQDKATSMALGAFEAEEKFNLGEMALRRDQFATAEECFARACELQPEEGEYQALHAWATYCNADDRSAAASAAMTKMSAALLRNEKSVTTRLYHAKLLKILGRNAEALSSFKILLRMSPDHREAELELRVLRELVDKSKPKKGFFGR